MGKCPDEVTRRFVPQQVEVIVLRWWKQIARVGVAMLGNRGQRHGGEWRKGSRGGAMDLRRELATHEGNCWR